MDTIIVHAVDFKGRNEAAVGFTNQAVALTTAAPVAKVSHSVPVCLSQSEYS